MTMRALLLALCACNAVPDAFVCATAADCGTAGACEPTGYCSVADAACASGRRYVAAGELDGTCVVAASQCAGFTGLACEGFEAAAVGAAWNVYTPNASFAIDPARAARGGAAGHFALHAAAPSVTTYGEIGDAALPTTATIATRAFYYFPAPPPYTSSRLVGIRQLESPFQHVAFDFAGPNLSTYNSITGSFHDVAVALPTERWICVELVVRAGDPGSVQAYLDGAELAALRLDETTQVSPPLAGAYFGFAFDAPEAQLPAYDYWIDEIATDATRIGCER